MTPPVRLLISIVAAAGALFAAATVFLSIRGAGDSVALMDSPGAVDRAVTEAECDAPQTVPSDPFSGLSDLLITKAAEPGELARRFRLAGTIISEEAGIAMAVLDDRTEVRQRIVSRGSEIIPGFTLVEVEHDGVRVSGPSGEELLPLGKAAPAQRRADGDEPQSGGRFAADAPRAATREEAAARFGGEEVFPGRWRFSRDAIMEYYGELRDRPERLLSVFDSMDPVWVDHEDGSRTIDGYVVGAEGEHDFFMAAGLQDGDVVKRVNKTPMTNRLIAEGLIAAFVRGDATMFVIEAERDGETIEQVFEIE